MRKNRSSLRQTNSTLRAEKVRNEQFQHTTPTGKELPAFFERVEWEAVSAYEEEDTETRSLHRRVTTRPDLEPASSLRKTSTRLSAKAVKQLTSTNYAQSHGADDAPAGLQRRRGLQRVSPMTASTLSASEVMHYVKHHQDAQASPAFTLLEQENHEQK